MPSSACKTRTRHSKHRSQNNKEAILSTRKRPSHLNSKIKFWRSHCYNWNQLTMMQAGTFILKRWPAAKKKTSLGCKLNSVMHTITSRPKSKSRDHRAPWWGPPSRRWATFPAKTSKSIKTWTNWSTLFRRKMKWSRLAIMGASWGIQRSFRRTVKCLTTRCNGFPSRNRAPGRWSRATCLKTGTIRLRRQPITAKIGMADSLQTSSQGSMDSCRMQWITQTFRALSTPMNKLKSLSATRRQKNDQRPRSQDRVIPSRRLLSQLSTGDQTSN